MARQTETLARISLFRSLDAEAIRRLDSGCVWRRARAGEWVLDYKDSSTDLFFVLHGHVRVMIISAGREVILRDIRDDEFFGEIAAIDGKPRSAGIVAVTDTVIARMTAATFHQSIHSHPELCDRVLKLLTSQIRMLANRVNEYSTLTVKQRIYAELLRLARPAPAGDASAIISPPPTHAEFASRVSTHREAVTRELKALERAHLLERRRGALVLLDLERLRLMVEETDASE
jgi:CRP/FNR family cyclic AMP-dependent transcriptional regulator